MNKTYVLTFDEVVEVEDHYTISVSEKYHEDFISTHRALFDAAADGDADAAKILWDLALDAGFLDDIGDRDVLDSIESNYGCEIERYDN
jgi:hypothetical protein